MAAGKSRKIEDTQIIEVSAGGRLDTHYRKHPIRNYATRGKTDLKVEQVPMDLIETFGFRGMEFGKWTTNEDRANFLATAIPSLATLAQVMGIPKAKFKVLGLKHYVGLAYGARGNTKAAAHFEPGTGMINLTRYPDTTDRKKLKTFFEQGGLKSFVHEYGHALDYFFGQFVDQNKESIALTFGRKVILTPSAWRYYESMNLAKGSYRWITRELLAAIIFTKRGKEFSPFYRNMVMSIQRNPERGTYWLRANELFARGFEQYIHHILKGRGIKKGMLVQNKYSQMGQGFKPYMSPEAFKKVLPWYQTLVTKMVEDLKTS